ncbi:MAG: SGNH/GDSL hydrolase family protein [Eubacteriaceae bacterium]|nr:SGNH/GDSL hydrolase family protein [Eubacteriaceae bacterium]
MRILCFGDSNTWGYDPETGNRFPKNIRWTGILQEKLGDGYEIIEEGLNGRTTVFKDPFQWTHDREGSKYLPTCLMSHRPLDVVIILLGTNDMKAIYNADAWTIAKGVGTLVDVVKTLLSGEESPKVIVISPPNTSKFSDFALQFLGADEKIKDIPQEYRRMAQEKGVSFLNATQWVMASQVDGIHLDEEGHMILAEKVYEYLKG